MNDDTPAHTNTDKWEQCECELAHSTLPINEWMSELMDEMNELIYQSIN